jgi:hypothetical protein
MSETPPNAIPPETPLTVTLTAAEWNLVMGALAEAPYKIAAPLIGKIMTQTMAGLPGAPARAPDGSLVEEEGEHGLAH